MHEEQEQHMLKKLASAVFLIVSALPASAFELRVQSPDIKGEMAQDLVAVSLLAGLKSATQPPTPQDILAAARADYARMVGLLYERGFFAPVISIRINGREATEIPVISPPPVVQNVTITATAGPVFRFAQADVTPLASGTEVPDGFATDQVATTGRMRTAVDAGITGWRKQGFAKARLASQSITARHEARRIDADLRLAPGRKLDFGDLRITSQSAVRESRIRDIAGLPSGAVFDPDELDRVTERLRRTGAFSVVSLTEAETPGDDGTLDIAAQLVDAPPRRLGFGAELSTQEGLTVSGFWLHRNLFGGAERLRISGEISGIEGDTGGEDYELSFQFSRPATFNEDTDFFTTFSLESRNETNFSSKRSSIEAGIRRYASPEREYTFGIGFEAANTADAFGIHQYRVLTFPASAEFDYRDNPLNATKGFFAKAEVTPFVGLTGTSEGVRTLLDLRTYRSTGPDDRLTFALRGQLGSVIGPGLSNAPTDFLFFSGGGGTVRGQEFQSLGVTQPGGAVSGGRSFLAVSGEVRVKTSDKLSLVGFLDAGYIGAESFPDGSSGDWHSGAGFGLRYDTGIGPIRVDLGVPVSGPGNPSGVLIYIGIGQAF